MKFISGNIKRNLVFCIVLCCQLNAQTVTGFLSRKPSSAAEGCGCTGCNDAAYMASVTYPDPAGGCGTTEPAANSGACTFQSKTRTILIPAGCTATINAFMGDRSPGCAGGTHGPGMDGGGTDQFSVSATGGSPNGNTGLMTGTTNQQVSAQLIQTGGQVTFYLRSDRVAELLTYTISFSGPGCVPVPLPVELIYFAADHNESDSYVLAWATASEKNSLRYEIECALDANHFYNAGSVSSHGDSYSQNYYTFLVPDTFKTDLIYFRLKMIDRNGEYEYSRIIAVNSPKENGVKVIPNPSPTGDIMVEVEDFKVGDHLEIYDVTGKKILAKNLESNTTMVDLKPFESGIYFLYLNKNGKTTFSKIVR